MIEINLLPVDEKVKRAKIGIGSKYFPYLIPLSLGLLMLVHVCLFAVYIIKNYQLSALDNKWGKLKPQRELLDSFKKEYAASAFNAEVIQQLDSQRLYWAEKLNRLSLNLPPGIWFTEILLTPDNFTLKGSVISLEKEEMNLINKFIDSLRKDKDFFKDFNSLELNSVQRREIGSYEVIDFILAGTLKSK